MKLFIYKSLLVLFLFLVGFHYSYNYIEKKISIVIQENLSKEKIELLKKKIREEMKVAIDKDDYISKEDADLINKFLNKIRSDLN